MKLRFKSRNLGVKTPFSARPKSSLCYRRMKWTLATSVIPTLPPLFVIFSIAFEEKTANWGHSLLCLGEPRTYDLLIMSPRCCHWGKASEADRRKIKGLKYSVDFLELFVPNLWRHLFREIQFWSKSGGKNLNEVELSESFISPITKVPDIHIFPYYSSPLQLCHADCKIRKGRQSFPY